MRLLLTRAAADARRTRGALEALGHDVIVSPLTEIVATGAVWPNGDVDALVATSAQAFIMPPTLVADRRNQIPLVLVGQRTLEVARARGFFGPATCATDVASLVAMLDELFSKRMRLVYWAGRDRKPDLEAAMSKSVHALEVVEAYAACATSGFSHDAVVAFNAGTIDAVLHFSRRSAELFLVATMAADVNGRAMTHFCLSRDVEAPLREAGFGRIQIAKAPNEAALFSLLG